MTSDHVNQGARTQAPAISSLVIWGIAVLVVATVLCACSDDGEDSMSTHDGAVPDPAATATEEAWSAARAELDQFLSTRDYCGTVDDCAIVQAECPLGCYVPVNRSHVTELEAKLRELRKKASGCAASCFPIRNTDCAGGRCVVELSMNWLDDGGAP